MDDYKFTKDGVMVSVDRDANLDELFWAFQGFLIACGWNVETVIDWYNEMVVLKRQDDKVIVNKDLMIDGPVALRHKTAWGVEP